MSRPATDRDLLFGILALQGVSGGLAHPRGALPRRSREQRHQVLDREHPTNTSFRGSLSWILHQLAELELSTGRMDEDTAAVPWPRGTFKSAGLFEIEAVSTRPSAAS